VPVEVPRMPRPRSPNVSDPRPGHRARHARCTPDNGARRSARKARPSMFQRARAKGRARARGRRGVALLPARNFFFSPPRQGALGGGGRSLLDETAPFGPGRETTSPIRSMPPRVTPYRAPPARRSRATATSTNAADEAQPEHAKAPCRIVPATTPDPSARNEVLRATYGQRESGHPRR